MMKKGAKLFGIESTDSSSLIRSKVEQDTRKDLSRSLQEEGITNQLFCNDEDCWQKTKQEFVDGIIEARNYVKDDN